MTTYYKFLAENLASGYTSNFYYPAPTYDTKSKKWKPSPWVRAADVTKKTIEAERGRACGHGLHLMKIPKPVYVRWSGNAHVAEGKGKLGEDKEKARFEQARLLRPLAFKEIFHEKANLTVANLTRANLYEANLTRANLSGANLTVANLSEADLSEANLYGANLYGANLSGANLTRANLTRADLYEANLTRANLTRANLTRADLYEANLTRAIGLTKEQLTKALCVEDALNIPKEALA